MTLEAQILDEISDPPPTQQCKYDETLRHAFTNTIATSSTSSDGDPPVSVNNGEHPEGSLYASSLSETPVPSINGEISLVNYSSYDAAHSKKHEGGSLIPIYDPDDLQKKLNNVGQEDTVSLRRKGPSWIPALKFNIFGGPKIMSPALIGERDLVIVIMGRVGHEVKRSFAEQALGDKLTTKGRNFPNIQYFEAQTLSDPPRNISLVYTLGPEGQKQNGTLRQALDWLSKACNVKRKFSGCIYLEDLSTPPPIMLSQKFLGLLEKCAERQKIVLATIGWDDNVDNSPMEIRHKELIEQWRPHVDRGLNVLRLSAPGKTSREVYHSCWDLVELVITRNEEEPVTRKRSEWKGPEKKAGDLFMNDPRDTDIVIPVMGPTGAGKSTFVNYIAGNAVMKVSHRQESCTRELQHIALPHPIESTRRIILVDTPGFDDTILSDSEILRRIAVWLARSYTANMRLAGVIYLHDITDTRFYGSVQKNLNMLIKLIGHDAAKNIVLVTTNWATVRHDVGVDREEQLSNRHWRGILSQGAQLRRFADSADSGWDIIQIIIDQSCNISLNQPTDFVAIQEEMVEIKRLLPDTEAGQTLRYTLEELLESQRQAAAHLRENRNSEEAKMMMKETGSKIRATLKQIDELSGNRLRALLKRWF